MEREAEPAPTAAATAMPHVLASITVFDPDGGTIRLGELWTERTVVLLFVRHFGCIFCRQQIAELRPLADPIRALGAELVVIGLGTVDEARAFRSEQALDIRIFTDPTREAYCAMEMRRGGRSVLSPGVFVRALKAWRQGFRQTRPAGDPLQQGGVVIIDRTGVERYVFISREAGEHPAPGDILAALRARP
jgi:peroxiredoxin